MEQRGKDHRRKRQFFKQRLIGLGMIILSMVLIWFIARGVTPEDRDCSFVLFTFPVGVFLLFTKELII